MPAMTFSALSRCSIFGAACLLLAACGNEAEAPAPDEGNLDARGEVLGGSISDAMLPLDTLTSQSPPMAVSDGEGETEDEDQQADEASEPLAEPVPDPAPATQPEPETEDPPADG